MKVLIRFRGLSLVAVAYFLAGFCAALAAGQDEHIATLWRDGDPGERLMVSGRIVDTQGNPVAGAKIFVRQANGAGVYTERYSAALTSAPDGRYQLRTALPGQYGPEKHIHVNIAHDAYRPVYTEIRFKYDPADNSDPTEILLEEAHLNGKRVFVGKFDVVLQR